MLLAPKGYLPGNVSLLSLRFHNNNNNNNNNNKERDKPQDRKEKLKRIYDQGAAKIRKQLSIARAEIERLKKNRKITKKRKKNRSHLQKEC